MTAPPAGIFASLGRLITHIRARLANHYRGGIVKNSWLTLALVDVGGAGVRPPKPVLAALALGLCLLLAACGQPGRAQPVAQQPGFAIEGSQDSAAQWADGYCGAVAQLVQTLSTMPSVDPRTPDQASRTSSELLGSIIGGLDRTLSGLTGLGPSPAAGADTVRRDAIATFSGIRSRTASAKKRIDEASADPHATRHALAGASAQLDEISKVDLLQGIDSVPVLAAASKRAPACDPLTANDTSPHFAPGG
jgi:hypothetical protein